jgi:hypothetical protein
MKVGIYGYFIRTNPKAVVCMRQLLTISLNNMHSILTFVFFSSGKKRPEEQSISKSMRVFEV